MSKVFVVIGGTSGIGLSIAEKLSSESVVYVGGKRPLSGSECGSRVKIDVDVTDESSVINCFEVIKAKSGRLDGLVYSAGITSPQHSIEETSIEMWQNV